MEETTEVWCGGREEGDGLVQSQRGSGFFFCFLKKACYFLVSLAAHSWIEQWVRKPQAKAALNALESLLTLQAAGVDARGGSKPLTFPGGDKAGWASEAIAGWSGGTQGRRRQSHLFGGPPQDPCSHLRGFNG